MGRPSLHKVKVLGNNGVSVGYRSGKGATIERYEPPNGLLTLHEAARLLRAHPNQLYRLKHANQLRTIKTKTGWRIRVRSVLRLRPQFRKTA